MYSQHTGREARFLTSAAGSTQGVQARPCLATAPAMRPHYLLTLLLDSGV